MVDELFSGSNNSCAEVGATFAVARRDVEEAELRPGGFVSGPSQFGLADAALWYLVFGATGRVEPMALTSELSIRFLRPAQGRVLWARATLESAGRRSVVGSVHVWCDDRSDKPTATAQGTYALPL
jgi:acyl-coenzyme A thioesterase PaaI-like protein